MARVSACAPGVLAQEQGLGELDIPVAVGGPEELVEAQGRIAEAVGLQRTGDRGRGLLGLADDPAVERLVAGGGIEAGPQGRLVHLDEAGGVPQLGDEVAVALDAGRAELDVAALGDRGQQRHAQGIGAIVVDDLQGVDHVALGLGHLGAALVAHQAVDVDVLERHLAGEVQAQHHHPGDPEEDDVEAGDQDRGRVEARQLGGPLGPAQGRERPQARGEPGVEHVLVATQRHVVAVVRRGRGHGLGLARLDEDLPVGAVPGRDLMAPPELARDAPGLDVAHPFEIGVLPQPRHEARAPVLDRRDRGLGQGLGVAIPLVGEIGLERRARAIAVRDAVAVLLDPLQQAQGLERGHDLAARLEPVEPAECLRGVGVDPAQLVQDRDRLQRMAPPDLEIVEIVGGRDLDGSRPLLWVGIAVGHDRDPPADQRQQHVAAVQVAKALVLRMHGDGGVAQHGLGPGGGDRDELAVRSLDRVAQMPEMAVDLGRLDLEVGDGRLQLDVPVDQPLVAIDQAGLVERHEGMDHGLAQALVHGEALAAPVRRIAEPAHLADDGAARLRLPLPDLGHERLAAELAPALVAARGRELALDHHLRGDAGMVGARLPQHVVAAHAMEADQRVLDGVVQGMADMQAAGDVGRRQDDAEGRSRRVAPGREAAAGFPLGVDAGFDLDGPVGLVEHGRGTPQRGRDARSVE